MTPSDLGGFKYLETENPNAPQASRSAVQGLVGFARDGDTAVLVELNSETDFVSRNEQFTGLLSQIARAALLQTPVDQSTAALC